MHKNDSFSFWDRGFFELQRWFTKLKGEIRYISSQEYSINDMLQSKLYIGLLETI